MSRTRMPPHPFTKAQRVRRRGEFQQAFKNGYRVGSRYFTLLLALAETRAPRVDEGVDLLAAQFLPLDDPISPLIPWTPAFGPSPIRVRETRARSRTARSTLIWEIPGRTTRADAPGY